MADNNAEVKDITKPVGTVDNTVDPNEIQLVEHVKEKHSKKINDMAKNRPMGEDNVVNMIEKKLTKRSKSELQLLVLIEQEISYREKSHIQRIAKCRNEAIKCIAPDLITDLQKDRYCLFL